MSEEQIQRLVAEVIARLALRLGADGRRGPLLVVFTGATVGFKEALQQVRRMALSGHGIQMAFSRAAERLYGQVVRDQLAGFPHIGPVDPGNWLSTLQKTRAVVVPLLSVNTLSKLTLLIADDLSSNLILHGLFMGKPVVVARNGADPEKPGRDELGFHLGTPALKTALRQRLNTLSEFGCVLADVSQLSDTVESILAAPTPPTGNEAPSSSVISKPTMTVLDKVITSVHVTRAHRMNANLQVRHDALITPLAREIAARCRVEIGEWVSG